MRKIRMVAVGLGVAAAISLSGCAALQQSLDTAQVDPSTYAPLSGKTLVQIGKIVIAAECDNAVPIAGYVQNVLQIVAPNSEAAATIASVFRQNANLANVLCPAVQAVTVAIGGLPTPAQASAKGYKVRRVSGAQMDELAAMHPMVAAKYTHPRVYPAN